MGYAYGFYLEATVMGWPSIPSISADDMCCHGRILTKCTAQSNPRFVFQGRILVLGRPLCVEWATGELGAPG